jgi:hypothetical protein
MDIKGISTVGIRRDKIKLFFLVMPPETRLCLIWITQAAEVTEGFLEEEATIHPREEQCLVLKGGC